MKLYEKKKLSPLFDSFFFFFASSFQNGIINNYLDGMLTNH